MKGDPLPAPLTSRNLPPRHTVTTPRIAPPNEQSPESFHPVNQKSEAHPEPSASTKPDGLSSFTCPVCYAPPTNATLTPCGHITCGSCLFNAVGIAWRRAEDRVARCPACRAPIPGWNGRGGGVIGLKPRCSVT